MRVRMLMQVVAAAGVLAACSDGLLAPGEREAGTFRGTWDGASWSGRSYAVLHDDTMTVVGHRKDPQYFYDEYIQARVAFTGPGTYAIGESGGQLGKIVGGDAGWTPPAAGTLVIRAYDASAHTVSGEVALRATSFTPAWDASGSFDAPVYSSFTQVPPAR